MRFKKRIISYLFFYAAVFSVLIAAAYLADQTVTVISRSDVSEQRHCIILDAGHGGEDGGAVSCTGIRESHINLEIALRLRDLLHLLGYDTKMIRTTDISVYTQGDTIASRKASDLKERVRIVNSTNNALFISIHQNNFPDGRYSGAQIFYNSNESSKDLATDLQTEFVQSVNKGSNRKAKLSSGVYLMEHIHCAAVLVECGFLSNPQEEAKLRSEIYQKAICCVIASSVSNYLDC